MSANLAKLLENPPKQIIVDNPVVKEPQYMSCITATNTIRCVEQADIVFKLTLETFLFGFHSLSSHYVESGENEYR